MLHPDQTVTDLKEQHKTLEKTKKNYYEVNDNIKNVERDLEDFAKSSKETAAAIQEKVSKRKLDLEKLQFRKQACQIAYVSQIVFYFYQDNINDSWVEANKKVPKAIRELTIADSSTKNKIETALKIFSQVVLSYGLVDQAADAKESLETIVSKPAFSLKNATILSEASQIKAKYLSRKIMDRFESYEEYCIQRAFWNKK